ncbi:MAG: type II CAAX endopeptidase family protein [Actinomycetota bacterium]|nr:type II CAAX endopeptidase family protein [Actinomycetota bacterium]
MVNEMDSSVENSSSGYRFPAAGRIENDWRRWGLWEIILGLAFGHFLAAIAYAIATRVGGYEDIADYPMWLVAVANFPLQCSMLLAVVFAATYRGGGISKDFLFRMERNDIFLGVSTGIAAQFLLVPALTYPTLWLFDKDIEDVRKIAEELTDRSSSPIGVIALVGFVGVFTPIAEELFFRGLVYGSLRKRLNLSSGKCIWVSMIISSAVFSVVHFQWVLLPALFGVGLVFNLLYEKTGRLAPAIWAHIGFNAVTLINLLV